MNPLNPDQATQVTPPPAPDATAPNYPRAMYHPTKGTQFVADSNQEAALIASDALWSETDPNATT